MTTDLPTLAALLTPLAPGAIAVIGLAGPATEEILRRIFRAGRAPARQVPTPRCPTFGALTDGAEILDDAVVVRIDCHGEHFAEINTHGGVRVAQRTLLLLEKNGAVVVDAEAWVARHDERHPIERDVDRTLLRAASRRLAQWLLSQRRILPAFLDQRDRASAADWAAFEQRSRVAIGLVQGLRVALIGSTNAGKSTLANRLFGAERVIASPEPGTTRDWVSETAFIRGWPVTLVDTAGIRRAACEIEAEAVRRARAQAKQADLVLVLLDATTPPRERMQLLDSHLEGLPAGQPRVIVVNKCDLAIDDGGGPILETPDLLVSALTGKGVDDLEGRVAGLLALDCLDDRLPTGFLPHHVQRE